MLTKKAVIAIADQRWEFVGREVATENLASTAKYGILLATDSLLRDFLYDNTAPDITADLQPKPNFGKV